MIVCDFEMSSIFNSIKNLASSHSREDSDNQGMKFNQFFEVFSFVKFN